jgi:hypothetical protein
MTGPYGRLSKRLASSFGFVGPHVCACGECLEAGIAERSVAVPDQQRSDEHPMCRWLHGLELKAHLDAMADLKRVTGGG